MITSWDIYRNTMSKKLFSALYYDPMNKNNVKREDLTTMHSSLETNSRTPLF